MLETDLTILRQVLNNRTVPSLDENGSTNEESVTFYTELVAVRDIVRGFAGGRLDQDIYLRGAVAGYLKTLQANLRHLTWQVEQVSHGDFSQRVDFMGDFATAFNSMVLQLEQSLNELKERESQLLRLTEELRENEQRWNLAVQCSRDGIWDINLETREAWYSDRLKEMAFSGLQGDQKQGDQKSDNTTLDFSSDFQVHPDDAGVADFLRQIYDGKIPPQAFTVELRLKRRDESYLWVRIKGMPVPGHEQRMIGVTSDISLQKETEVALAFRAMHDNLTGLPNRYLLNDRLEQHVAQARRSDGAFILVTLDLDNFKGVNDTWGHAAGDILLKELGNRIKMCLRNTDTVARLGGDEFVFIYACPLGNEESAAKQVLGRLYRLFEEPVDLGEIEYQIQSSMGVAFYPRHTTDLTELFEQADEALYKAKEKGKNIYAIWGEP